MAHFRHNCKTVFFHIDYVFWYHCYFLESQQNDFLIVQFSSFYHTQNAILFFPTRQTNVHTYSYQNAVFVHAYMKLLSLFSSKWICHNWHRCFHNKMPGQAKVVFNVWPSLSESRNEYQNSLTYLCPQLPLFSHN